MNKDLHLLRLPLPFLIAALISLLITDATAAHKPYRVPMLSPEETIKSMQVADGYRVELVASEPMIEEPAVIEWDANGKLYVAEMLTYMQNIDGTEELTPRSRITLLEDTNWDGVMDKSTVFVDKLILPRMLLALEDRLIVRETGTFDLWSYRDTNGDGVADEKIQVHKGGNRGGNLEHQPSGLLWNIDNWVYTTYSRHRYRYRNGSFIKEPLPHGSGQWGLAMDDIGKLYYSTAGGEMPAMDFQQPIIYGQIRMSGELADGFRVCYPIDDIPDTQGGRGRLRADNTLNWFTGVAGQTIFRGDGLPNDFYGDLIIPEPVGRLIRRAKVNNINGKTVLSNAYEEKEFIASTDPNFRPVNSATGPDGCLYIADMYRGIIQEGAWVRPGSYLRGVVQDYQLDRNIGRGRIYRVMHETSRRGPRPHMLDQSSAELVAHLSHRNGWWRDHAQRLIVLRQDRSVIPALKELTQKEPNPLGRLHGLWTLEGLDVIDRALCVDKMSDPDWRVRAAAIRVSERLPAPELRTMHDVFLAAARDQNPNVGIQLVLSAQYARLAQPDQLIEATLDTHPENEAIKQVSRIYFAGIEKRRAEAMRKKQQNEEARRKMQAVKAGEAVYKTLCFHCHGEDGKGMPTPGMEDVTLAPSLVGSPRVNGHPSTAIRILLHGLTGPVDDKTYTQPMVPMESNGDVFVANVLTFVRSQWGHTASMIEVEDVTEIRKETGERVVPWTLKELQAMAPPALEDRKSWKLTASHGAKNVNNAIDGKIDSRYSTDTPMRPGMWYQIEFPHQTRLRQINLDTSRSGDDYPRGYDVHVSEDGRNWGEPVAQGHGTGPKTEIRFKPARGKFLRITQTGRKEDKFWSIHEMQLQ